MSVPPKNPKEAFEEIVKRRSADTERERIERAERQADAAKQVQVEQQAFLEQDKEAKVRAEKREEWRQERHADKREDEEKKRKADQVKKEEEERQSKLDAEQKTRDDRMTELHRQAIAKKRAEAVEGAKIEEGRLNRNTAALEDRTLRLVDVEAKHHIEHIENEAGKRTRQLQADAAHLHEEAEEAFKESKKAAQKKAQEALRNAKSDADKRRIMLDESNEISHATAARRKILFDVDSGLEKKVFDIETEKKRLIAEVEHQTESKEQRVKKEANRKRTDAAARRERVADFFGKGDAKKDSKDPMSIVEDEK